VNKKVVAMRGQRCLPRLDVFEVFTLIMHACSLVPFGLELSASIVLGDPLLNNRAIWLASPTLEVSTVSTNPLNSH